MEVRSVMGLASDSGGADRRMLRSALTAALTGFGEANRQGAQLLIWQLIGSLPRPPKNFFDA